MIAVTIPVKDIMASSYEPVSSRTMIVIDMGAPITAPATAAIPQIIISGPDET